MALVYGKGENIKDTGGKDYKKEQDDTETGEGKRDNQLGKGANAIKPPKKKEMPKDSPDGQAPKGSKDDGKDGQTSRAGREAGKGVTKSESSDETPSGVNDMEIPHVHLPEMLHQKEGDEVHLHVYGKVKSHNMSTGKNHSVVSVTKVHRDGDQTNNSPATPTNAASAPLDQLKQSIKGSSPDTYSPR
jgi:hypothetical protein